MTHKQRFKVGDIVLVTHDDDEKISWVGRPVRITGVMDDGLPFDYYVELADGHVAEACYDDWELELEEGFR